MQAKKRIGMVIAAAGCVALAACVNLEEVRGFAASAKTIAESAGEFGETMRRQHMAISAAAAAETYPALDHGQNSMMDVYKQKLADLRRLQDAITGFRMYAAALEGLADYDNSEEMKKAAEGFEASFRSFAQELGSAEVNDGVLAPVIIAVADILMRVSREAALRDALKQADPQVQALLNVLVARTERVLQGFDVRENVVMGNLDVSYDAMLIRFHGVGEEIGRTGDEAGKQRLSVERARLRGGIEAVATRAMELESTRTLEVSFVTNLKGVAERAKKAHTAAQTYTFDAKEFSALAADVARLRSALGALRSGGQD